ncbi:hypothetical protein JOQ06_011619 [Pogonophryne albipinna]|uniref:Uncharacterized protein n=1 Tax=Pogonophryne albipinna TaxID=1090488 RepID=A0AAD6BBR2_9TELE|nr:hypothetical protein JOQ06_011619 [Pogonophryne albipinna]
MEFAKKRKVDQENRQFKTDWTEKEIRPAHTKDSRFACIIQALRFHKFENNIGTRERNSCLIARLLDAR